MSDDGREKGDSPHRPLITLVEVVVVVVIGILVLGLVLPRVYVVRHGSGYRTKCMNNLKQLALAAINASETQKKMPPAFGIYAGAPSLPANGSPAATKPGPLVGSYPASIWYHLLPYIEESGIYNRYPPFFNFATSTVTLFTDSSNPAGANDDNAAAFRVPTFICQSDGNAPSEGYFSAGTVPFPSVTLGSVYDISPVTGGTSTAAANATLSLPNWGTNSYAANWLIFGALTDPRFPDSIPDGTSKTILFTEKFALCNDQSTGQHGGNLWAFPPFFPSSPDMHMNYAGTVGYRPGPTNPTDPYEVALFQDRPAVGACNPTLAQTAHEGGINVAMGDGSVRFVSSKISPQTWSAALTPAPIPGISYPVGERPGPDKLGSDWND